MYSFYQRKLPRILKKNLQHFLYEFDFEYQCFVNFLAYSVFKALRLVIKINIEIPDVFKNIPCQRIKKKRILSEDCEKNKKKYNICTDIIG